MRGHVTPARVHDGTLRAQLGCEGHQAGVDLAGRLVLRAVARIDGDAAHVDAALLRARLARLGDGATLGTGIGLGNRAWGSLGLGPGLGLGVGAGQGLG